MKFFLFIALTSLTLLGCSKNNSPKIDLEDVTEINEFSPFIESYYYDNKRLPKSFDELADWINDDEKIYFENAIDSINKIMKISYVPIKSDEEANDFDSYVILGSLEKKLNTKLPLIEKDLNLFVSLCEYNSGKKGDVILDYNSIYLFNYKSRSFDLETSKTEHWKSRVNYYIEFQVDSTFTVDENLNFKIDFDEILIKGKLLNNNIKKSLEDIKFPIKLKGLKVDSNEDSIFLDNVIIVPNSTDYNLLEKYVDDKRSERIPYHLKECK